MKISAKPRGRANCMEIVDKWNNNNKKKTFKDQKGMPHKLNNQVLIYKHIFYICKFNTDVSNETINKEEICF